MSINRLKAFAQCCNKWVRRFGLTDWEIGYKVNRIAFDRIAEITTDAHWRWAEIILQRRLNVKCWGSLASAARHEVLHLLLADLLDAKGDKARAREEHKVIARLDAVLREMDDK